MASPLRNVKRLAYQAKWRLHHPQAFAKYERLLSGEYLSLDELMARQEIARQQIVRTAMRTTAFYPRFYGAVGFELGDIGRDGWFERLPLVTKHELRTCRDEFINAERKRFVRWFTTGGSTGEPVKTGFDRTLCEEVYNWRLLNRFGVHPWDHHAYLWRDLRPRKIAKFVNAALWWPTRHLKCDVSSLDALKIESFLARCRRIKPTLIYGYVGALTQVAQHLLSTWRDDARLRFFPGLKFVWSTSAPLSAVQRKLIETAFGVPVCDEYGSCECRWIAAQCPECKGLHVNVEHVHLEFLDVASDGYGRTVITNLEDTSFPLIRYENGDRGRWLETPCACGRTLPCIDSVKGRVSECLVLPSGKTLNGEYLTTIFDSCAELVRGFRIVQHVDASIAVECVAASASDVKAINDGLAPLREKVAGEVPVELKLVEAIPHDRGKLRFVVREMK